MVSKSPNQIEFYLRDASSLLYFTKTGVYAIQKRTVVSQGSNQVVPLYLHEHFCVFLVKT